LAKNGFFGDARSPLAKKNLLKNAVYVWLCMVKTFLLSYSIF